MLKCKHAEHIDDAKKRLGIFGVKGQQIMVISRRKII